MSWLALLLAAPSVLALDELQIPSVSVLNGSSLFSLSSLSSPSTYKLSLSLCSLSNSMNDSTVLQGSNDTSTYTSSVHGGMAQMVLGADSSAGATVNVTLGDGASAWLGVMQVDESEASSTATLESMDVPLFYASDADNVSAVFFSPTYYPPSSPLYTPLLFPDNTLSPPEHQLLSSPCFVSSLLSSTNQNITSSQSTQGIISFTFPQGGKGNITNTNGERFKYLANDLSSQTNYTLVGLEPLDSSLNNSYRVWGAQYFNTKSSTNCRLLQDLDFCPNVAYSVPSPSSMPTDVLISLYRDIISNNTEQFNTTLSTFPCGQGDQGLYSPVQSCDTCLTAYTTWLCGVVMPRCDDVESTTRLSSDFPQDDQGSNINATTILRKRDENDVKNNENNHDVTEQDRFDQMFLEETKSRISFVQQLQQQHNEHQKQFQQQTPDINDPSSAKVVRTDPSNSRTPFLSQDALNNLTSSNNSLSSFHLETPFPYTEILPCSSTCHQVAAACPPLMSWTCPIDSTIAYSYGKFFPVGPGDVQGGDYAGPQYLGGNRASDRWGDVYCNALFTDRIFSIRGQASPSLKLPFQSFYHYHIYLVLVLFVFYSFL